MWQVIGKKYSQETQCVLSYLEGKHIAYTFIDLEEDPVWEAWLRMHKIITIPAIRYRGYFIVGCDLPAIDRLLAGPLA